MNTLKIKIKKLHPSAKIPIYASEGAAGFDIYSVEDVSILPGETKAVGSGIAVEVPEGKVLEIWDRGGMGFRGIHRFAGVVDSDYRGEIKIVLNNSTKETFEIKKGERIAQGMIKDFYKAEFEEVGELEDTARGEGWNHSTGKN